MQSMDFTCEGKDSPDVQVHWLPGPRVLSEEEAHLGWTQWGRRSHGWHTCRHQKGGILRGNPNRWCGHGLDMTKPIHGAVSRSSVGLERGDRGTVWPLHSTAEGLKDRTDLGLCPSLAGSAVPGVLWVFLLLICKMNMRTQISSRKELTSCTCLACRVC